MEEEPDEVWQRRDRDQVWHALSVKASRSPEISSNGLRDVQISLWFPALFTPSDQSLRILRNHFSP